MSNHENEIIAESICERACELLSEFANETFAEVEYVWVNGQLMDEDLWSTHMVACGWVDRKIEELYEGYPEGPC